VERDDGVRVEVAQPLADGALDVLEVLRRVRGLHVAARRGPSLHLPQPRPEFGVAAQRRHHDRVPLGALGVTLPRVVLLKDGVMNDGRSHAADYARVTLRGQLRVGSPTVRAGFRLGEHGISTPRPGYLSSCQNGQPRLIV
jgi:hypothetical protein